MIYPLHWEVVSSRRWADSEQSLREVLTCLAPCFQGTLTAEWYSNDLLETMLPLLNTFVLHSTRVSFHFCSTHCECGV